MTDAAFAEDDGFEDEAVDGEAVPAEEPDPIRVLLEIARTEGDLSHLLTGTEIARIGADVVEDYRRDKTSRAEWEKKVERALKKAAQEECEPKTTPWENASNVNYPILTEAALQFNARAYPAIVKGEEAVSIKVFGMAPKGPPAEAVQMAQQEPMDPQQAAQVEEARAVVMRAQEMQARWQAKLARSGRVKEFLNYTIFYSLTDWESDTDALLVQLPIVGCAFRKIWWDPIERKHCAALVHALRLVVPMDAKSVATTPRITEEIPDVYPYQIRQRMRSGQYRTVVLPTDGDDTEAPRMLLEQHRYIDLDKDGVEEPYIATVDLETQQLLCIQANFSAKDVKVIEDEETGEPQLVGIDKDKYYVKYDFFPHPEGKFYGIGFGHLLDHISQVIDTAINQLNDAGTAAIAGGGFIAGGLRLQGAGKTTTLRWRPGEYKVASAAAGDIRNAIWERTLPQPSPVTFNVLDMMLGAAKDIAAIKDVITGEAPANTPVGTTLALIEQGLQVFTALYKRVYRSLKEEFGLLFDCMAKYADEELIAEYGEVLDDPDADFVADFDPKGFDIRPVSDPQSVTRMQKIAKGQVLLGLTGRGLNDPAIYKRAFEAMDIEDPEELLPQAPPPGAGAEEMKTKADAAQKMSAAKLNIAKAGEIVARTDAISADPGRLPGVEGPPGDEMGPGGLPQGR